MTVLSLVQASASRMSGLIDNVLDFARGRLGGGLTLSRGSSEPLAAVLEHVVEELRVGATDRQITTAILITEPVDCDGARIGQMLSNLLANALTHGTPDRPVILSASTDANVLEISVTNGGKPIPPDTMDRLFQPFFRGQVRPSPAGAWPGVAHRLGNRQGPRGHLDRVLFRGRNALHPSG